jgi:hypothetical protein
LVVSIEVAVEVFQHLLSVHSDFLNADLQKVFVNKTEQVQACIDAHGHHFQHLVTAKGLSEHRSAESVCE